MRRFATYVLNLPYSLGHLTGPEKNPAAVELVKPRAKRLRPQRRTESPRMQEKRAAILSKADLSAKVAQETLLVVAKPEPAKLTKEQRSAIPPSGRHLFKYRVAIRLLVQNTIGHATRERG
jgi:hypothetical protein